MAAPGDAARSGALPSIGLVVARSRPGNVIGYDNRLPWHLKSDLRRFRALTMGSALVMGRKTWDSIGRPLPGRLNVVVSRAGQGEAAGTDGPQWAASPQAALAAADAHAGARGCGEIFVIGGGAIFRHFLDAGLISRVYLTSVEAPEVEGDVVFDQRFAPESWRTVHQEDCPAGDGDDHPSRFEILERIVGVMRSDGDRATGSIRLHPSS